MTEASVVEEKIKQIIGEMKELGLWKKNSPDWVNCLQEVRNSNGTGNKKQIVLQAKQFLAEDINKGKLLQLLIELDAVI